MIVAGYILLSLCAVVFIAFFTIGAYKTGGKSALIASVGTLLFFAAITTGLVLVATGIGR